jgi:cell division transport system ATP-binding protein
VIRLTSVSKIYPNGVSALKDVSFHIPKGQFVFLTGHSGAGKSSILRLIIAEEKPSHGDVRVSGFPINKLSKKDIPRLRRKLGIVCQDFRLLEYRNVEDNVGFALEVTGTRPDQIPSRVIRVLTQVGLASKAKVYPKELSGGEQQRVALARALVNDPAILIADEPTGNLDERATRSIFQLLKEINAGGTVVVMATHNLALVRDTNYRVIELKGGAVVYDSAQEKSRAAASGTSDLPGSP